MPGLSQLQQFNSDLLNLGDEVKIRSLRGEKPVTISIPQNIEDKDDSEDFKFGMPAISEEELAQADAAAKEREREANDFSDITGETEEELETEDNVVKTEASVPDMSDLLDSSNLSLDDLDLSDFEEETPVEPPKPKEIPIEDMDLEALLAPSKKEEPIPEDEPEVLDEISSNDSESIKEDFLSDVDKTLFETDSTSQQDTVSDKNKIDESLFEEASEIEEIDSVEDDFAELETIPEIEENSENKNEEEMGIDSPYITDEDFIDDGQSIDLNETLPSEFNEIPDGPEKEIKYIPQDEKYIKKNKSQSDMDTPDFDFSSLSDDIDFTDENENSSSDSIEDIDISEFSDDFGTEAETEVNIESDTESFADTSLDELNNMDFSTQSFDDTESENFEVEGLDDISNLDFSSEGESESEVPTTEGLDDISNLDFSSEDESESEVPTTEGLDDISNLDFSSEDESESEVPNTEGLDDISNMDFSSEEESESETPNPNILDDITNVDFSSEDDVPSTDGLDDLDNLSFDDIGSDSLGTDPFSDGDFSSDNFSSNSLDNVDFGSNDQSSINEDNLFFNDENGESPSPDSEVAEETFDTSAIDSLDFSSETDNDFELGGVSGIEGDDDDIFNIPGFSDTPTANLNKPQNNAQQKSFSGTEIEDEFGKPKNTFTDLEYEKFKTNLATYPLNIRVALEDLVVKNELTDDALFEILTKVLRKVPARTLASDLEKILDISLDVPRDFERRSAVEYENYKQSLEYQLKNKVIPGAIISVCAAIMFFCLYVITRTFVYDPLMAKKFYKQGYELIQEKQYPQSEEMFDKALTYKPVKKWYFTYADAYRKHRQYDRARLFYKRVTQRYNHDKEAGLLWADLEANDLFNYEEGERILKREVLDYHINDSKALIQLGDLYLDWASELDPEKFPLAKEQYDLLIELYGSNDLYLSREMRYFIRTDNLRQVLMYKNIFFNRKKALGSKDLTELSGYLLDKRYGKLRSSEESLRSSIEDLLILLERAYTANKKNPVALYNLGRYYVETNNGKRAVLFLSTALKEFENQTVRNKRDTYKFINAYRLLGEEYSEQKEYLLAEENYGKGIDFFEKEREVTGFESNEDIGKLYSDLADLDYFIAGDFENALANYINAVENKYDTGSVRYRIGYIQYQSQNFNQALGSFIRSLETEENNSHLLLALANTLSINGDNYIAKGYYETLLNNLSSDIQTFNSNYNNLNTKQIAITDLYMKASNNLGVTLSRLADMTGDSSLNAKAIVNLQESLRVWDYLTRDPESMIRLEGTNLAEMNVKYISNPLSNYEAEIYTEIPRILSGEKELK